MDIQYKKLVVQLTSLSTVTGSFNGIASDVTTSRLDPDSSIEVHPLPKPNKRIPAPVTGEIVSSIYRNRIITQYIT